MAKETAKQAIKERSMSLYDLAVEGQELERALIQSEGELTPELEEVMDRILLEGKEKMEAAASVVASLQGRAESAKWQADLFYSRTKSWEKRVDALKRRMLWALNSAYGGKLKTSLFTIWSQTSAPGVKVDIAEGHLIEAFAVKHPQLVRIKYELNVAAVKVALEEHGPEAFPELSIEPYDGTEFIQIR